MEGAHGDTGCRTKSSLRGQSRDLEPGPHALGQCTFMLLPPLNPTRLGIFFSESRHGARTNSGVTETSLSFLKLNSPCLASPHSATWQGCHLTQVLVLSDSSRVYGWMEGLMVPALVVGSMSVICVDWHPLKHPFT